MDRDRVAAITAVAERGEQIKTQSAVSRSKHRALNIYGSAVV